MTRLSERIAADVLKASGSGLQNYTMNGSRERIIEAASVADDLLEALQDFCLSAECAAGCDEGVDPDTAYSEILSFAGSALASSYDKARAAISKATGEQS